MLDRGGGRNKTSGQLLGVGGTFPWSAPWPSPAANTLLLGIAPPGGKIPLALAAHHPRGHRAAA